MLKFTDKIEASDAFIMSFDIKPRFYDKFFRNEIYSVARNKADATL